MTLSRLVYASESCLAEPDRAAELGKLLAIARELNERNHITGFLLATPFAFAQVLEGPRENLAETYGRIVIDPRHSAVNLLSEAPIMSRLFGQWSMGVADHDETTQFIFGLHGVTPETDLTRQPVETLLDLAKELSHSRA